MNSLQLSLKKQWFELTKAGIKTEDYREINEYWLKRLTYDTNIQFPTDANVLEEIIWKLNTPYQEFGLNELNQDGFKIHKFTQNIMTLGYPKSTDTSRILKLEHKGIEIREGNPEWGAEPGKLYFVIKHGEIINE